MLRLTNASSSHQRATRANYQAQSRHLPAAVFLHQRYSIFTFIQSAIPHSVGTDREPQAVILRRSDTKLLLSTLPFCGEVPKWGHEGGKDLKFETKAK